MATVISFPSTERARFTILVAQKIRRTGFRFDASWRHAGSDELKGQFYERCCTFAANDIADNPEMAAFWAGRL